MCVNEVIALPRLASGSTFTKRILARIYLDRALEFEIPVGWESGIGCVQGFKPSPYFYLFPRPSGHPSVKTDALLREETSCRFPSS